MPSEARSTAGPPRRPADVPEATRDQLNAGIRETATLAEWLAVDFNALSRRVRADLIADGLLPESTSAAEFTGGITKRLAAAGLLVLSWADRSTNTQVFLERLRSHRSDVVRQWCAYALLPQELPLQERLAQTRRFAADSNMSVREVAWMTLRPAVARDLDLALTLLKRWVQDEDPNIRRCAIEVTRPRSVWGAHLPVLKQTPELGEPLLDHVHADQSRYVRLAAGNWINDASKSRPDWALRLAKRWSQNKSKESEAILRRGLRTLRTNGLAS